MAQKEEYIIDLDSDDDNNNNDKSSKTNASAKDSQEVEVCDLSSDSEDDIIVEEVKCDVEVVVEYNRKKNRYGRHRENNSQSSSATASQQSVNNSFTEDNDSIVSPRPKVNLPPVMKNSPKTPNKENCGISPNSKESRIANLDRRLKDVHIDSQLENTNGSPQPVQTIFCESPQSESPEDLIDNSIDDNISMNNDEEIEGVVDNSQSVDYSISQRMTDSCNDSILQSEQSLSQTLVSQKIDVCIQAEPEDTEIEDQNESPIIEHYICCYEGCGQEFNNALLHYKHEKKHLKELQNQGIKTFKCSIKDCTFAGLTHSELIYHNSEHNGHFVCRNPLCMFRVKNAISLNQHMKTKHNSKKRNEQLRQKSFKCLCGEISCR